MLEITRATLRRGARFRTVTYVRRYSLKGLKESGVSKGFLLLYLNWSDNGGSHGFLANKASHSLTL